MPPFRLSATPCFYLNLGRLLAELMPDAGEMIGLLALMLLCGENPAERAFSPRRRQALSRV